ncbi:MAG TPA: AraC family transcriptional regulator [Ramlibacter sp.]|nr:AraC family transcriptional regulator [Ramlibacter sp.]
MSVRAKVNYWLAPGLPSVELSSADYGAQRFSPHWHAGFAVGIVTRGTQGFRARGRAWRVRAGDLILLDPREVHDGFALAPGGWSSRMAYVPEGDFAALAGIEPSRRFVRPCMQSPQLAALFLAWHRACAGTTDIREHPLTSQLFTGIAALMQRSEAAMPSAPGTGLREQLQLAARADAQVRPLTTALNLSRSGTWRRVKTQFGLAPKPLLKHLRLMEAKSLLAQGRPIVEAALACGFHDQSHLTRQFAAAYGFTPAQFRRAQITGRSGQDRWAAPRQKENA